MFKKILYAVLLFLLVWAGCKNKPTEPPLQNSGSIQGTVRCLFSTGTVVLPSAHVFWGDSLLATTDSLGKYQIDGLEAGDYLFTCSALNCRDYSQAVQVKAGYTITLDFDLEPDSSSLTPGAIQGVVRCGGTVVKSAYIFWGDSLLTTTDAKGLYWIDALEPADYLLTASALFCGDTTLSVQVQNDSTVTLDFNLVPDFTTGRVYGEFQDDFLFQQRVLEDAGLASMTEQEICDGGTGATLQAKTLGYEIPDRTVSLGDSVLAYTDGFGQYWLTLPTGTYPLTGACEGYKSQTRTVTVPPDGRVYLNFYLPRVEN